MNQQYERPLQRQCEGTSDEDVLRGGRSPWWHLAGILVANVEAFRHFIVMLVLVKI